MKDKEEFDKLNKKSMFDKDKDLKDNMNHRINLEQDCRKLEDEYVNESGNNYDNKMTIEKDKASEELIKERHERDVKHLQEFIAKKDEELKTVEAKIAQEDATFQSNAEVQKALGEIEQFKGEIEEMNVKLKWMQLTVTELDNAIEILTEQKEDHERQIKELREANED